MTFPSNSHLPIAPNPKTLLGFLLILSLSLAFAETNLSDAPTAYELLESFNFPRGILPRGVQSYLLRKDGTFEVYLGGDCEFKVTGAYQLRYKTKITGTVESGTLKDLNGVSVKVLFLWIGISGVVRSGDELKFYVGPLSASFPLSNFEECPRCGGGFDCAIPLVSDA
ncbi:uncharacterized protein LOC103711080 [Phoenix dactylifera]|uniref:Uncharacterized protein LOC103711080 n=1 Tax=Phoenix dactylifera TaxID=42345 RepID=A0A8B7CAS8_PHODC|nr:uncharacterized protein LOC103711080 [Phoenix dactylifera]